jgi:hypothetical protein
MLGLRFLQASLLLPLFLLKGRLRYVTAFLDSGGKARWRWNGKKFDFVLHPGCHCAVDPRDPDTEKNLGKDNRYYHLFRRHGGILDETDLKPILPGHPVLKLHSLWNTLGASGYLDPYRERRDEAMVTDKILTEAEDFDTLLKKFDLSVSERYLLRQLLQSYKVQFQQKAEYVSANIVPPPLVSLTASGHIRLLQHHRIFGAMDFGVPIAVDVLLNEKVTLN